ncbi:MAG TPA: hypothetical protein PLL06_09360, partial [Acidobacteriota bacterium]|nr:hypothetical protein [Acidobacteriota bacterium]
VSLTGIGDLESSISDVSGEGIIQSFVTTEGEVNAHAATGTRHASTQNWFFNIRMKNSSQRVVIFELPTPDCHFVAK